MERVTGVEQQGLKRNGGTYRQRQPLETIFHQVIDEHFPNFLSKLEQQGDEALRAKLPDHVEAEFDAYLKCGILEHGFVKMSCEDCKATLLVPLSEPTPI